MMLHIKRLLAAKPILFFALLYTCCITVLFFIPNPNLPKVQFSSLDKIAHGFIYFGLVNLWMLYLYIGNHFQFKKQWMLVLLLSVLLYGIIIEIFQGLSTT